MEINFSVPQGSILGPVLYSIYASPLEDVISQFESMVIGYADDHGIYRSFEPTPKYEQETVSKLELCLAHVHNWMNSNKLKLNPSKTEFIMFGGNAQLQKCCIDAISVSGANVHKSTCIKYLGVYMDNVLSYRKQVNSKCKAALFNYSRIKSIRKYLDVENCKTLVSCLILSHIDYANVLYYGLPDCEIQKLQRVQNMAAKLVLNRSKYDSASECLKLLHWLPVKMRINYKLAVYVYKCLHGCAPSYIADLIKVHTSQRALRSTDASKGILLHMPLTRKKTFADRSFSLAAPKVWNNLPVNVRGSADLQQFKSRLKTHLFETTFN